MMFQWPLYLLLYQASPSFDVTERQLSCRLAPSVGSQSMGPAASCLPAAPCASGSLRIDGPGPSGDRGASGDRGSHAWLHLELGECSRTGLTGSSQGAGCRGRGRSFPGVCAVSPCPRAAGSPPPSLPGL